MLTLFLPHLSLRSPFLSLSNVVLAPSTRRTGGLLQQEVSSQKVTRRCALSLSFPFPSARGLTHALVEREQARPQCRR